MLNSTLKIFNENLISYAKFTTLLKLIIKFIIMLIIERLLFLALLSQKLNGLRDATLLVMLYFDLIATSLSLARLPNSLLIIQEKVHKTLIMFD